VNNFNQSILQTLHEEDPEESNLWKMGIRWPL